MGIMKTINVKPFPIVEHGITSRAQASNSAELVNLFVAATFTSSRRQNYLVRPAPINCRRVTARPSDAFANRRLNTETSAIVRKQYLTVFSGRSTYISHSKSHPSSQSNMSMQASSNDSAT